jgi:lipoprotein-releasing system ATP-binding protein
MSSPVLQCNGLGKTFVQGKSNIEVLKGLDLEVEAGTSLAIIGHSGAGKSTLLHLLGGLDQASAGTVSVMGQRMDKLGNAARGRLRNEHMGFVYQFHHLLPEFSAVENVAMPLLIGGCGVAEARSRAIDLLTRVGLAHRLDHKPSALSGGERQRAAVARALVNRPACVLADEPTGNLDEGTALQVYEQMLDLNRELGTSLIIVTHDQDLAARMDRCLLLTGGQLKSTDPP